MKSKDLRDKTQSCVNFKNSCNVKTNPKTLWHYQRAVTGKNAIDMFFDGENKENIDTQIENYMRENIDYDVETTFNIQIKKMQDEIGLYMKSENRTPELFTPEISVCIMPETENVFYVPDKIFRGKTKMYKNRIKSPEPAFSEEVDYIEVVKYRFKKPDIAKSRINEELELFAGIKYLEEIYSYEHNVLLVSSYYFMGNDSETRDNFFGEKNVVRMYSYRG